MRGLIDKPPTETATAPSPERRRSRLAAWLAALRSRLSVRTARSSRFAAPGREHSAQRTAHSAADPITPEVQTMVQAAFPRPDATASLQDRVATVCRPPEAAPCGARQGPPNRPRTRNGLQPGGWGHVRPRWGWVGVALVVAAAIGLSMRREHDVLAAAIRKLEAAPVIHVVAEGRNRRGIAIEGEGWLMKEIGGWFMTKWDGRPVNVVLDDLKFQYDYNLARPRATVGPSVWRDPKKGAFLRAAFTGTDLPGAISEAHPRDTPVTDTIVRDRKTLTRIRVETEKRKKTYLIDPISGRMVASESESEAGRFVWRLDYPDPDTLDWGRFRVEIPVGVPVYDQHGKPLTWPVRKVELSRSPR